MIACAVSASVAGSYQVLVQRTTTVAASLAALTPAAKPLISATTVETGLEATNPIRSCSVTRPLAYPARYRVW
jgi:hypothetical protein